MNTDEAKILILTHAGLIDAPQAETSFIGCLRPFRGLREENFHQIMEALIILTPMLQQERVDRELLSALWTTCQLARQWGVDSSGMLVRNNLLSNEDQTALKYWIDTISWAVFFILQKGSIEESMSYKRQEKS